MASSSSLASAKALARSHASLLAPQTQRTGTRVSLSFSLARSLSPVRVSRLRAGQFKLPSLCRWLLHFSACMYLLNMSLDFDSRAVMQWSRQRRRARAAPPSGCAPLLPRRRSRRRPSGCGPRAGRWWRRPWRGGGALSSSDPKTSARTGHVRAHNSASLRSTLIESLLFQHLDRCRDSLAGSLVETVAIYKSQKQTQTLLSSRLIGVLIWFFSNRSHKSSLHWRSRDFRWGEPEGCCNFTSIFARWTWPCTTGQRRSREHCHRLSRWLAG